mmetsp:Transcript_15449/g.42716  ORF Transcript_15449/g.42716 Transcript_15449/m.42716 type:complete len:232 (-) Transcript_15449:120-815(-)
MAITLAKLLRRGPTLESLFVPAVGMLSRSRAAPADCAFSCMSIPEKSKDGSGLSGVSSGLFKVFLSSSSSSKLLGTAFFEVADDPFSGAALEVFSPPLFSSLSFLVSATGERGWIGFQTLGSFSLELCACAASHLRWSSSVSQPLRNAMDLLASLPTAGRYNKSSLCQPSSVAASLSTLLDPLVLFSQLIPMKGSSFDISVEVPLDRSDDSSFFFSLCSDPMDDLNCDPSL